jgi:DNA-directed RNA polymerase specialized sigma24 family protein
MCDVPKRQLRPLVRPARVAITAATLAAMVAGWILPGVLGVVLMGLGIAALVGVVLIPSLREVEFGLPPGARLSRALQDRQDELRMAFESQYEELSLCAQLLCDDPATASALLEEAWARTAAAWRGPVTAQIRTYTLCDLIHLIDSPQHGTAAGPEGTHPDTQDGGALHSLASLAPSDRAAVVLHEFADLSAAQISRITGRSKAEVRAAVDSFQPAADGPDTDGDPR